MSGPISKESFLSAGGGGGNLTVLYDKDFVAAVNQNITNAIGGVTITGDAASYWEIVATGGMDSINIVNGSGWVLDPNAALFHLKLKLDALSATLGVNESIVVTIFQSISDVDQNNRHSWEFFDKNADLYGGKLDMYHNGRTVLFTQTIQKFDSDIGVTPPVLQFRISGAGGIHVLQSQTNYASLAAIGTVFSEDQAYLAGAEPWGTSGAPPDVGIRFIQYSSTHTITIERIVVQKYTADTLELPS